MIQRLNSYCCFCIFANLLHISHTVCPPGTKSIKKAWGPLPWRDPVAACQCPAETFCRGPYCLQHYPHEPLQDQDTEPNTNWSSFLEGCGAACSCLPSCTDYFDCWSNTCVCGYTLNSTIQPRDPKQPHSPHAVRQALAVSFPDPPGRLDPRYKNPCWHIDNDDSKELRCLPYVYIPGILKCATSALYDILAKHQQIEVSYPKETHWWTRVRRPFRVDVGSLQETGWLKRHARTIFRASKQGKPEPIVLEGSASMFWDQPIGNFLVPELVQHVTPNAKFILMVRDPVDRLYSDYMYFSYRSAHGKDPKKKQYTYDAHGFDLAVRQSLQEMQRCLKEYPAIVCAWEQRRFDPRTQIQLGLYSEYLETWQRFFPAKNFLVVRQEDMKRIPRATFDRITSFLGIPPMADVDLLGPEGHMKQSNSGSYKSKVKSETRKLLDEFYAPFNVKLANLIGDNQYLFHLRSNASS